MAITDNMVSWLQKNISLEEYEYGTTEKEKSHGFDWKLRLQDFNDRNLTAYFANNDGEKRWVWILSDLEKKARHAGRHDIENHLNGFADENAYQTFLSEAKQLQRKMQEMTCNVSKPEQC